MINYKGEIEYMEDILLHDWNYLMDEHDDIEVIVYTSDRESMATINFCLDDLPNSFGFTNVEFLQLVEFNNYKINWEAFPQN